VAFSQSVIHVNLRERPRPRQAVGGFLIPSKFFRLLTGIREWTRTAGLVPTESSSGAKRSQGSITKTGNTHARRLLVEAAWHHRNAYRPGLTLQARWDQAPAAARARGHEGNHRLHHRWEVFTTRKKRPVIANVAIARELAG